MSVKQLDIAVQISEWAWNVRFWICESYMCRWATGKSVVGTAWTWATYAYIYIFVVCVNGGVGVLFCPGSLKGRAKRKFKHTRGLLAEMPRKDKGGTGVGGGTLQTAVQVWHLRKEKGKEGIRGGKSLHLQHSSEKVSARLVVSPQA